jgi:hypothetical protein
MQGRDRVLTEKLSFYLLGGTEENHKNSIGLSGISVEIRTENLAIGSLDRYY